MCGYLRQIVLLLLLLVSLPVSASHNPNQDWVQVFRDTNLKGPSVRFLLPTLGKNWVPGIDYLLGSHRRVGSQLLTMIGGVLYHGASSFHIKAKQSGVTLYLFEGDNFDGRMLRWHIKKGWVGKMGHPGWFNDRLGSMIVVRERTEPDDGAPLDVGSLDNIYIPLDTMVDEIRSTFSEKMEGDNDIEDFWLHDTQVFYDTAHSFWNTANSKQLPPGAQGDTAYRSKYYDQIRIKQEIEIDPNWWPSNYDTWVKLGYYFNVDSEKHLNFTWSDWKVWVESGWIDSDIKKALSSAVKGDLVETGNTIRDTIRDGISAELNELGLEELLKLAPELHPWEGIERVGWKIPCAKDNYNDHSGYGEPKAVKKGDVTGAWNEDQIYCWAAGSRKEMFPPTLILHHDPQL